MVVDTVNNPGVEIKFSFSSKRFKKVADKVSVEPVDPDQLATSEREQLATSGSEGLPVVSKKKRL